MIWINILLTNIYNSWEWRHMSVMASQTTNSSTVCSQIFRLRWNKNKATHYWLFLGEFPGFPSQCRKRFYIMTSSCSDSFVLSDYDLDVLKAYQSFTPGAFPSSWHQMLQSAWWKWKMLIYRTIFLKPLMQSSMIFLEQSNDLNNKLKLQTPWFKHRY